MRLDYLSCTLTILSTLLVGPRHWQGWLVAALNSLLICCIGFQTGQLGFIPANLFCLALYGLNLRTWRRRPMGRMRPRVDTESGSWNLARRGACVGVSQSRVGVRTRSIRLILVGDG